MAGSLQLIIFLAWAGYAWCDCVSTAAALSLPITLTATISYMILGWGIDGLPDFSLGYVYLPGTFGLMIPSMLMAVAGARLAHYCLQKKKKEPSAYSGSASASPF